MSQKFKGEVEVQTGFGLPRHTTTSRNAYTPSAKGYKVFDTNLNTEFTWNGSAWEASAVTGDYVDLTSNQTIAGTKTFNDIPIFAKTEYLVWNALFKSDGVQGLSFASDANGLNGYLHFDESTDSLIMANRSGNNVTSIQLKSGNVELNRWLQLPDMATTPDGNAATTVDYVNSKIQDATITDYVTTNTAQTISGAKTFSTTLTATNSSTEYALETNGVGNGAILFRRSSAIVGSINASATIVQLKIQDGGAAFSLYTSQARMSHGGSLFYVNDNGATLQGGPLYLPAYTGSENGRHATTKDYVDSKFVTLNTTQLIGGTKTFSSDVTLVGNDATLIVSSTTTNHADDAIIELKTTDSGGTARLSGKIYVDSSANALKIGKYNRANGSALNNELAMYDTYSQFTDEVRGVTGSNSASFVTRSFVESEVASIVTDHGGLTGLGDDDHSQYHTDARGDARYYTKSQTNSLVNAKEDSFSKNNAFNKNFGTTSGTVTQGNDSRLSNARTPTAHTHTLSDITDFNDSDYVDTSSNQNIGGSKTFTSNLSLSRTTPYLDINATSGNGHLRFQENGQQRGIVYWDSANDRLVIRTYADNGSTVAAQIFVDDAGYISSSVEHRGVDSTTSSSFTTRGYVDGEFVPDSGNTTIAGTKTFTSPVIVPNATASNHALNRTFADARYIQDTGNTTISGTKTFTSAVIVPNSTGSTNALNTGTADGRYVQDTGNTTISGTKTFTTAVIVPSSTGSTNALNTGTADGRYFRVDSTNETAAGNNTFTGTLNTFNNDVSIGGTLNVAETAFVENLTIDQDTIILNNYYSGSGPSQSCGIIVNRGDGAQKNAIFRWNESSDQWEFGVDGDMNSFSSRAYAESKISRSGDWMYGELGFRLPNSSTTADQQNGVFFREHGDNGGANYGGVYGKQFTSGGKRVYLAHMLGSSLNSYINVDEENIAIQPTETFYIYRQGKVFCLTGTVNSGSTFKLSLKSPTSTGSAELSFESGSAGATKEVRIASNPSMTASYTMILPASPPSAGQVLTCQSLAGQVATLHWA